MKTQTKTNRFAWTMAALAVVCGGSLRFTALGDKPFWLGEIQEIIAARSPRFLDQLVDSGSDVVGFFWHHLVWLLGWPPLEFVSRLPAALAGTAVIAVIYRLGTILYSELVGVAASFFMALSFFHVQFSQDARSISYLVFFLSLSWLAMLEIQLRGRWRWAPVFAVSGGLVGLSHALGVVHLLFQAAFFIGWGLMQRGSLPSNSRRWTRSHLMRYLLPATGAVLLASFQLVVLADYGFAFRTTPQPVTSKVSLDHLFLLRVFLAHIGAPLLPVTVAHLLLALGGLVMLSGEGNNWRLSLFACWFAGPPVAIYLLSTVGGTARLEMYHLLPVLPPFLLASATGLAALVVAADRLVRKLVGSAGHASFVWVRVLIVAGAAILLQVAGNGSATRRYLSRPTRLQSGPDMKSVAKLLESQELGPHDVVFLNYSEEMATVNFHAGRLLKQVIVVTPWKPVDKFWQHHLLVRAAFQTIDSDIERLDPDEIVALDEVRLDETPKFRRGVCLLFWPERTAERQGLGEYLAWLEGDMLYVNNFAVPPDAVPRGWSLHRFPGVDVLVTERRPCTIRALGREVLPLLFETVPPMLHDLQLRSASRAASRSTQKGDGPE